MLCAEQRHTPEPVEQIGVLCSRCHDIFGFVEVEFPFCLTIFVNMDISMPCSHGGEESILKYKGLEPIASQRKPNRLVIHGAKLEWASQIIALSCLMFIPQTFP